MHLAFFGTNVPLVVQPCNVFGHMRYTLPSVTAAYMTFQEIFRKMDMFNFSGTVKSSPHYLTYAVLKNCNASVTYQLSMKLSKNKVL